MPPVTLLSPGALCRLVPIILVLCNSVLPSASAQSKPAPQHPVDGYSIYVVPHSHMDLEWMWTYQQARAFAIKILRQALSMLKADPHFAFTQDQLQALKPFWESLSESDKNYLKRAVTQGRFEVATGMVVQPDVNEPDFESLTRQLLLAKPWLEKTFGAHILTAWNVDTFGQTIQMPQLFRRAGIPYFVFSRDQPPAARETMKNLFYWKSPDGSTVLTHFQSGTYGTTYGGPGTVASSLRALIRQNPAGNDKIMLPWGSDEYFPIEDSTQIAQHVRKAAAEIGLPLKSVEITTPSRYFKAIEDSTPDLPTYTYDFNPPFALVDLRGIWGERPGEKLAERDSEDVLESSERLSSIANSLGEAYPTSELTWGWARLLYNQSHDTMAGSHSDAVHHVAMSRYAGAIEAGREALADALFQISRRIDTSQSGSFPIVVFNALSFPRTELVRDSVVLFQETNLAHRKVDNFRIIDSSGKAVPFRAVSIFQANALTDPTAPKEPGPLSMALVEFDASEVPALGYRVYRIEAVEGALEAPEWHTIQGNVHTPFFDLRIDPSTGSIAALIDRRSGRDLLDTRYYGGNELVLEEERKPDMEGPIHFDGNQIRGSQFRPDSITALADNLGTTIRIRGPFMGGERIQEITLHTQSPRIDFKTELRGIASHDGMLTVMFPLRSRKDSLTPYETHNAVTRRPDGIYDAGTWVDVETSEGGIALLNKGTGGHRIGGPNLQLILLRSVVGYRGYYAPEASEAGDHVFEYGLYPHSGGWTTSGVVEQAHSFDSGLIITPTDAHYGSLPPEYSFLSIKEGHFEVTALKKAEQGDDFILRGHEIRGETGTVRLHIELPAREAWAADLLEQPRQKLEIHGGDISFDCKPFEFVTVRLRMPPGTTRTSSSSEHF